MYNNRHWLSDVVAGAGFGILSTKVSYLLYPKLRRLILRQQPSLNYQLAPSIQNNTLGFRFSGDF